MLYHCLLIGLQDLEQNTRQRLTREQLQEEICAGLSASDLKLFELLLDRPTEDEALLAWYGRGQKAKNSFLRDWFTFNFNLENILTAVICRKHAGVSPAFDVRTAVLGDGELQEALRTSNQKDFGLTGELPELDAILRLSEVEDLYERERRIDALRWEWLEGHTAFHYFERENVFAYWLQAQMLFRWDILNKEEGARIFKALVADMKKDVKF